jgi:hypothetical protein
MALPISPAAARKACQWLKQNFGQKMQNAVSNTPFTIDHLCAIVCQETAYRWLLWVQKGATPQQVLAACVLDGSGDAPNSSRNPFPQNTAQFRKRYGNEFTAMLVNEGNKMRQLMGWGQVNWIYKGYGIFQYDLQAVGEDEAYFRQRKWHDFDACLERLMGELRGKLARVEQRFPDAQGQEKLRLTFKAYNGSGPRAEVYSRNVMEYAQVSAGVQVSLAPATLTPVVETPRRIVATSLEFEMALGASEELLEGVLIVRGENQAVHLNTRAVSGRIAYQTIKSQWEMGKGPLPAADVYTVDTMGDQPESNGQQGLRFPIYPLTVKNATTGATRSGFHLRAAEDGEGTSGGIAVLDANDFRTLRMLLEDARAAGAETVPLKVVYTTGTVAIPTPKTTKLQAVFSMALRDTTKMLYGTLTITDDEGAVLYEGRATSGLAGYQHPGAYWVVGRGVVPPTGDERFIMMNVWNNDAPMGTRYQITPERVWNATRTKSRSAFRVHFDQGNPGSAGCIVTPSKADYDRIIKLFAALKKKGVEKIPLVLDYT